MKIFSFYRATYLLMLFAFHAKDHPIRNRLIATSDDFDNERPPVITIIKK